MNAIGLKRGVNFAEKQKFVSVLIMFLVLLAGSVITSLLTRNWYLHFISTVGLSELQLGVFDSLMNYGFAAVPAVIMLVGRAFGTGESSCFRKSANSVMLMVVIISLLNAVLAAFLLHDDSVIGMLLCFLVVFLSGIGAGMRNLMYAAGDVVRPTVIVIIKSAVRAVLTIVCVRLFNTTLSGIFASALVSEIVDVVLSGMVLFFADSEIKPEIKSGFSIRIILCAFAITAVYTLQTMFMGSISNHMLNELIGATDYNFSLIGIDAAGNLFSVLNYTFCSLSILVMVAISQACGADDADKALKFMFVGFAIMLVGGLICSVMTSAVNSIITRRIAEGFVHTFAVMLLFTITFVVEMLVCALRARGSVLLSLIPAFLVLIWSENSWRVNAKISDHVEIVLILMMFCLYTCLIVNIVAVARSSKRRKALKAAAAAGGAAQPANAGMNFDPMTGKPLNQTAAPKMNFDPMTGKPLNQTEQPDLGDYPKY